MKELSSEEVDQVSGAHPVVVGVARFVTARVTGKVAGNAVGHATSSSPVSVFINAEIAAGTCSNGVASVTADGFTCA